MRNAMVFRVRGLLNRSIRLPRALVSSWGSFPSCTWERVFRKSFALTLPSPRTCAACLFRRRARPKHRRIACSEAQLRAKDAFPSATWERAEIEVLETTVECTAVIRQPATHSLVVEWLLDDEEEGGKNKQSVYNTKRNACFRYSHNSVGCARLSPHT